MQTRIKAVFEVLAVYILTLALIAAVGLSPIGRWERGVTNRMFLEYVVMIAFPLLWLVISRRNLADYGITLKNLKYHLDVALAAFLPVAIACVPLGLVNYKGWDGAIIMAIVEIAVLFVLGRTLKKKLTSYAGGVLAGLAFILAANATLGKAISALVFYTFFLGLGEELLFRGYIQSRLNLAFGKPFQFYGVQLGWGILITSLLFGLMHIINLGTLITGHWQLTPWWGFWTFFGGLVLGYVREKTGSIIASTLLHGLPQGIAYAFLGL